ncbi:MAG TPA: SDR family NAD(P)-dependent oxidoreductase [Nitrospinota bacterium]|jgi:NADP-dependent 3-hydroxy acid dehydrogenase YdfG|nr:SDR family NAD(P)-dependent oxidoreductase [Nitrospinota bacterium]|tara:strand:- start:3363 stop:4136 length:774 start_codon:yes stop_codon:yes gene_type:complete
MTADKSKVAIITGASSGIGKAVADLFAHKGYSLMLGARRIDRLEKLVNTMKKSSSGKISFCELDLTSTDSCVDFAVKSLKEFNKVDIVINCAGVALGRETAEAANPSEWEKMIHTNYSGPIRLFRELLPAMKELGDAHIINIGALAALHPHPGSVIYASAKEAMRMFLKCLREDMLGSGIRITNIDPGITKTEFALVRFRGNENGVSKMLEGLSPLEAVDIAECVWFAASRPKHVNIDQITVLPTDQSSPTRLHRTT